MNKNYIIFSSKGEKVYNEILFDKEKSQLVINKKRDENNIYEEQFELLKNFSNENILFIDKKNDQYGAYGDFSNNKLSNENQFFLIKTKNYKEKNQKQIKLKVDFLEIKNRLKKESIVEILNKATIKGSVTIDTNLEEKIRILLDKLIGPLFESIFFKCDKLLHQKKQIILYGPPGTGKTRNSEIIGEFFMDAYSIVQFHPSYQYEDFIRGISSEVKKGSVQYVLKDKILINMANLAEKNKDKKYLLIIDEINRANLPSVFGELIYALEKRDKEINTPYGKIKLPSNLYIIGTMNTADRSAESIDYAIRRRFKFVYIPPNIETIKNETNKKAFQIIQNFIINNINHGYDPDDFMLGHSYFLDEDIDFEEEIKPLLIEYVKDGILKDDIFNKIKKANYVNDLK